MKKIIALLSLVILSFVGCQNIEYNGTFSIEPLKPQVSEPILVKFSAYETKLTESNSVDIIIYQYDVDVLKTTQVKMKKEGNGWIAKFTPLENTKGIIITFKEDEIIENNSSNGFIVYLNDVDGNTLPEAIAGHHVALSQWGTWYAGLESNNESTSNKFEDTFSKYPNIKNAYLDMYLYTLSRIGTDSAMSKLSNELVTLKNKTDLSEDETIVLAKYSNTTENIGDTEIYENMVLEKYPKSKYASEIANKKIMSAETPEQLKAGFIEFQKNYPNSELAKVSAYRVIRKFIDANDIKGAIETANELKEISHPYAFIYSTKKIIEENYNEEALELIHIGVDATRNNLKNNTSNQPRYLSKSGWDEEREYYFSEILKIAATVQNKPLWTTSP